MIIVDASIASKWVLKGEMYEKQSFLVLKNHINEIEKITVPDLIFLEIANVLSTKSKLSWNETENSLKVIFKANLDTYRVKPKEILTSAELAKKYQTSVYDMLYAVIAKNTGSILITADENFIQKTGFKFVKHIKDV